MSNIQTGAERMPHELSYLGFLAGKIGRRITMSTTAVISGDSCEMDAVGAFFFSSRRRHPGLQGDWSSDVCSSDLRAFDYFDRNGDHVLDAKEVAKMSPPNAFLQGINFIFNGGNQAPRFIDLDTNKDGKIDREEFATYFRRNGLGAVQVNIQPPNAQAEQLTTALYKQLG